MSINELVQSVQFLTDAGGQKTAVLIDIDSWEEIVTLLEDIEDAYELQQAKQTQEKLVDWETVIVETPNLGVSTGLFET